MAFANVVFPDPGLSSIKTLPSDKIAASVNLILFSLPTTTFETSFIKLLKIIIILKTVN